MAELGKIQRPNVDDFQGKRRLFCIPNIFVPEEEDEKLKNLIEKYWHEAIAHVERLEKLGFVTKLFIETLFIEGQEASDVIRDSNPYMYILVSKKVSEGATIVGIEDSETFGAYIDWANCLRIVRTEAVMQKVFENFAEVSEKRIRGIADKIDENLKEGETAILILRDQDRIKLNLPKDIDLFLVVPSVYDDILRHLREKFLK